MSDLLESARLKLDRADDHFAELNEETSAFLNSNSRIEEENSPDGTERLYRLYFDADPPELRTIVGDILHNLHSALDHCAWALVSSVGELPEALGAQNRIQYPIYRTESEFRKLIASRLPGVSEHVVAELERWQPWYGDDPYPELFWLYELSNIDKHRQLNVVFARGGIGKRGDPGTFIQVNPPGHQIEVGFGSGRIQNGAVIAYARGVDLPNVNVEVGYGTLIVIEEPRIGGILPLSQLEGLRNVVESVLDAAAEAMP